MIKIMANIRKEIESQLMSGMPAYLRARLGLFAYLRAQTINRIIGEIQNNIHIHHGVGIMIVLISFSFQTKRAHSYYLTPKCNKVSSFTAYDPSTKRKPHYIIITE